MLTPRMVAQFKQIVLHYLDFVQKQKVRFVISSLEKKTLDCHLGGSRFLGSVLVATIHTEFNFQYARLVKIRKDQHNLPIYQYKEKIIEAVRQYQVVVVAGDTGCGKSTQVNTH